MGVGTKLFNMTKDVAGYNGFGLEPADFQYSGILATGVVDNNTVLPNDTDNYMVVFTFSAGSNVFVKYSSGAVVPVGVMAANLNELNPAGRKLAGGTTISLITPDAAGAYCTILAYGLPRI